MKVELIKRPQGFYVPKFYDFWTESGEPLPGLLIQDSDTKPPSYCYDSENMKWRLDFTSKSETDENIKLSYFFDTERDIFIFLRADEETEFAGSEWD